MMFHAQFFPGRNGLPDLASKQTPGEERGDLLDKTAETGSVCCTAIKTDIWLIPV